MTDYILTAISAGVLNASSGGAANDSHTQSNRPKFDLGASLARPLTWKPHVGALKPLNPASVITHEKRNIKEVKLISR